MAEKTIGTTKWSKVMVQTALFRAGETAMSSVFSSIEPFKSSRSISRVPSYLYNRNGLYYFRVVISDKLRSRLGRSELRISLRTAYRQLARNRAHKLYFYFGLLLEKEGMLDYGEIKRRLNQYLRKLLEQDHNNLEPRMNYHHPKCRIDLDSGEMSLCQANIIKIGLNNKEDLHLKAQQVLPVMIQDGIITKEEINENNYLAITKAYLQMQMSYHQLMEKRWKGDFLAEEQVFAAATSELPGSAVDPQPPGINAGSPKPPVLLYSQALEQYINAKINDGSWRANSLADHRNRLESFLEVMGDKSIDEISRQLMREFRDILRRLPPNRKRTAKYKNKTIKELLALNVEATLNVATVNVIVEAVAGLFEWCVREDYLAANPAKELQIKDSRQAIELRDPFSIDDLRKIFAHQKFTDGKFKYPAYFWVPIIGLYTGMRLEEIAQLHCADIYQDNGLWVIDINDRGTDEEGFDKNVKNSNAVRIVPIHQALIDLGLTSYHQKAVEQGSVRLFKELKKTAKVGKYGKQPGKQFKAVVSEVLDDADKKSFHSLRHTFADFYKQRGLQTDIFRQLYGHDIPELAARQYGSKFPPEKLYEVLSKLDYGLDLSHLVNSRYINIIA